MRSESERASHWKIVFRVMPGVEGWWREMEFHVWLLMLVRGGQGDHCWHGAKPEGTGWEWHQAVALTQGLMSSAWQGWRWLSLVFHAVISHCSLTTSFPAVTRNTALWKGARNSSLNSFYEYISKGQTLWNDTLQSLETSHQRGETSLKTEINYTPAICLASEIS